jgi:hypothetical protein
VRSKSQLQKTASTLKLFTNKIKKAQDEEVLTPETVKEIAQEIMEVAEVATELAAEISEGVPVEEEPREEVMGERREENNEPEQIEVAQDDDDDDDKKKENNNEKEMEAKLASLRKELSIIKREATLGKLAPKYAALFPKSMQEAKLNEILKSKQPMEIVEAKIQEASDIIKNKTMVKVASMTDSIFEISNMTDSEEVNIAAKL